MQELVSHRCQSHQIYYRSERVKSEASILQKTSSLLAARLRVFGWCLIQNTRMVITVQNVTANTAMVIWPTIPSCADSFYSIMYQSNWNTMMSGYSREHFQRQERIPASRTFYIVENLTPLTTYILCVTCQSANPTSDQCKIFHTSAQDPSSVSSKKKDLALGIWLTSSVILLIIACILLYGCLHIWWRKRQDRARADNVEGNDKRQAWVKGEKSEENHEKSGLLPGSEENKREETGTDGSLVAPMVIDPLTADENDSLTQKEHEEVAIQPSAEN